MAICLRLSVVVDLAAGAVDLSVVVGLHVFFCCLAVAVGLSAAVVVELGSPDSRRSACLCITAVVVDLSAHVGVSAVVNLTFAVFDLSVYCRRSVSCRRPASYCWPIRLVRFAAVVDLCCCE